MQPLTMQHRIIFLALLLLAASAAAAFAGQTPPVPAVQREFRGVWVATVANIDWPSKRGLSTARQQAQLIKILDRAAQLHLNAVILQVRPACDALYQSSIEPWSEYLTGRQGQPPNPLWDPLQFAVEEAHKRGLELHAWFNPFRARHPSAHGPLAPTSVVNEHPDWVRHYGDQLWLDPGIKAVQDYSISVIMDVVKRYDVDGVHIDDYFYPYPETDAHGHTIPFPDQGTYHAFRASGGSLSLGDWRRSNVDQFIQKLYQSVKAVKPWVKFGVSPFGIWRPNNPPQIRGYDAYREIYCDSRKWLREGWLDYISPQLYWRIQQTHQSFPVLLHWWISQNLCGRHVWPGTYTSRVASGWPASEIVYQVKTTQGFEGSQGDVQFSMKALLKNTNGVATDLLRGPYVQQALVPASPWLGGQAPQQPQLTACEARTQAGTGDQPAGVPPTGQPGGPAGPPGAGATPLDPSLQNPGFQPAQGILLTWQQKGDGLAWQWVVQICAKGAWTTRILPGGTTSLQLEPSECDGLESVAVSGVSRTGLQGPVAQEDVSALAEAVASHRAVVALKAAAPAVSGANAAAKPQFSP